MVDPLQVCCDSKKGLNDEGFFCTDNPRTRQGNFKCNTLSGPYSKSPACTLDGYYNLD